METAFDTERKAWAEYSAYCLDWRRRSNRPRQDLFTGDHRSRKLGAIWMAARRALQAVSHPRHGRNSWRFRPRHVGA